MSQRCVVAVAGERVYPYRESTALAAHRHRLLQRADGDILDLSPQWHRNRGSYPLDRPTVVVGDIDRLDLPARSVDTVVAALALCGATEPDGVLTAAARWLRPGGRLLVLEHVRAAGVTGGVTRLAAPVARGPGHGCRLDLDVTSALRRAGFELTDVARFSTWTGLGLRLPFLAGVARPDRGPR